MNPDEALFRLSGGLSNRFSNETQCERGVHGEVVAFEGQVDPQPRTGPRPTGGGNPTRYEQPGGMGMGL